MNARVLLLIGSLAANAVLVALLVIRTPTSATASSVPPTPASVAPRPIPVSSWSAFAGSTDSATIARLRSEGFPAGVIRAIVTSMLSERFAARRAALPTAHPWPFWRDGYYPGRQEIVDPAGLAARRALDNEYSAALEQLLGNDALAATPEEMVRRRNTYGDLSPEKIRRLEAVNRDYADLRRQVQDETRGIVFPEDQAKYDLLEQERRADLAAMLTPAELEAYDLRSSPAAQNIRGQLNAFNPTEAEFKALYQVQLAYDRQYGSAVLTADESRRLREAMVQPALTPERFADYQVTTAGSYPELSSLVNRLQLPATATGDLVRLQRQVAQGIADLTADSTLDADAKNARLLALAQATDSRLVAVIGPVDNATRAYLSRTVLRGLPPPPSAPAAPPHP